MSHATRQLQPQLSAPLRIAAAAGVCALLALGWTIAEQASQQAVQTATAAFTSGPAQIASPLVQTAGRPSASGRRS